MPPSSGIKHCRVRDRLGYITGLYVMQRVIQNYGRG
jgi:hypothetical protein